jgi:8-oxo-dGTP pyrophosphatase MutT (NUDIX family)
VVVDPRKLVGTEIAAREIGISRAALWRWAKQGAVTPAWITVGGQYRWNVDDLRRQIQDRKEASTVEPPPTTPEAQPVVAAIVTSRLGVLIGRRNDGKPPWGFITGEIEPGESTADAALREVKEETGLQVQYSKVLGRRVHPKTQRTMVYLACRPVEGTSVFVGDTDELAEVRWASFAEAVELLPGLFEPVRMHLLSELEE